MVSDADTPQKKAAAAKKIASLKADLKLPGRLPEELAIYETELRAAPVAAGGQGPRPAVSASVLRARVATLLSRMQPEEAGREMDATPLSPEDPAAKKALSQKVAYIIELQKVLIDDLNRFCNNRLIARRSGPVLKGRIVQADANIIQVEPADGGALVAVPWADVMPSSVLVWTDSVSGASMNPGLLWLGGVYASVAGYPREAAARAARAAELRKEYVPFLPLLQPAP